MICNKCANTRCRENVDRVLYKCKKYIPVKGGWKFGERALATSPQATHELLRRFGLKISNDYQRWG